MARFAALLVLVFCSCASRYDAVPNLGYIRSLDNFGNARGAVSVGIEFWPVQDPGPAWLAPDRHRRMGAPAMEGELPEGPARAQGSTETDGGDGGGDGLGDEVTISGPFGLVQISQELMKLLLLPMLMGGGYVWQRRRRRGPVEGGSEE